MRQLKTFMRNRKKEMLACGPCECRTLQCWRLSNENCGCGMSSNLQGKAFLTGDVPEVDVKIPGDNYPVEEWQERSRWIAEYDAGIIEIRPNWRDGDWDAPYIAIYEDEEMYNSALSYPDAWYLIYSPEDVETLRWLLDRASQLQDWDPIELTNKESAIVMSAYKQLNKEVLSIRARNIGTEEEQHWVLDLVDNKWQVIWTFDYEDWNLDNWAILYDVDMGDYIDARGNNAINDQEDVQLSYKASESMRHWLSLETVPFAVSREQNKISVEYFSWYAAPNYYDIYFEDIDLPIVEVKNGYYLNNLIGIYELEDWYRYVLFKDSLRWPGGDSYIAIELVTTRGVSRKEISWYWKFANSDLLNVVKWLSDEVIESSFYNCDSGSYSFNEDAYPVFNAVYNKMMNAQDAIAQLNNMETLTSCIK